MVHSEMSDDWGYAKLHEHFEKRAIDEMKHAEKLIGRILFLEGIPIVSNLKKITIGSDTQKQLANDHAAEEDAIKAYNDAIKLAGEVADLRLGKCSKAYSRRRPAHRRHRVAPGPDMPDDAPGVPVGPALIAGALRGKPAGDEPRRASPASGKKI